MTDGNQIPIAFEKRILVFKNQVNEEFCFLKDFKYILNKEQSGRTEIFLDYFYEHRYSNDDTVIKIHFSTDIISGMKAACM